MTKVAIYCRLSDEDRDKRTETDESESIQNQKSMLLTYAMERGWSIYKLYCDEDYSGADKNRPEWCDLIKDAENRKFDIVLCKTQSRFSRDMEMVEKYIHGKFLEWGIRFIGVVDNADTEIAGNKKSRQINGLVNEWYLEDLSDNIRRTLNHKKSSGQWLGSFAPYGYKEDPNDRNHLVIDPVAAKVVKEIFELYLSGKGYITIAKILNDRGIPNPYTYKQLSGSRFKTKGERITSSIWTTSTIYQIIRREVYTGTLVQCITENISYKSKKRKRHSSDEWLRTPNAHEAIISEEVWNAVSCKLKSKKRSQKYTGEVHIFSGKVYCLECKNTMWKLSYRLKDGQYQYLRCKTVKTSRDLCDNASSIRLDVLENTVKCEINKLLDAFYNPELITLSEPGEVVDNSAILLSEQQEIQKLIEKKEKHLRKLYEDRLEGIITEDQFLSFNKGFSDEIETYKIRMKNIEDELAEVNRRKEQDISKEIIINKYRKIEQLDRSIVDEFIDSIYIGKSLENLRTIEINWKI